MRIVIAKATDHAARSAHDAFRAPLLTPSLAWQQPDGYSWEGTF
jgi:hypothetical protein